MIKTSKPLSTLLLALALVFGAGSVLLFAGLPLGALRIVRPDWPTALILLWDAGLSLLFFVQHSGMIRARFRTRLARRLDRRYHTAVYAIASGLALAIVVLLWQPSAPTLVALAGLPRRAAQGAAIAALAFFIWAGRCLRPFDPLGVTPLVAHLRDRPDPTPTFVARGPYRWVRHPLYLAVLVLLWSCPDVTLDRVLFDGLWTAWIVLGARWEEADLLAEHGEAYRAYCREVPMLLPWPRPARPDAAAGEPPRRRA